MQCIMIFLVMGFGLGLLDKILGNKMKLAEKFDLGLGQMSGLYLSMFGIYCAVVSLVERYAAGIQAGQKYLPFDISVLLGCFIAPDMGGYRAANLIAENPAVAEFSGLLVTSIIGTAICFTLPIMLVSLAKANMNILLLGVVIGFLTCPVGLIVGGLILGLPIATILINLLPILVFCTILLLLIRWLRREKILRAFISFGNFIRFFGLVTFGLICLQMVFPQIQIVDPRVIDEIFPIILKIVIVVCGATVWAEVFIRYAYGFFQRLARLLAINEKGVVGVILSLINSLSMFLLYEEMDNRGKLMNIAFCIAGAYSFGGQLSYVMMVGDNRSVAAFIISKVLGGMVAVACVHFYLKRHPEVLV